MYSVKNLLQEAVLNDIISIVKTYSEEEKKYKEYYNKFVLTKIRNNNKILDPCEFNIKYWGNCKSKIINKIELLNNYF